MEGVGKLSFWSKKKVLITGHSGFKGSWLSLWLQQLGAEVIGYSSAPPTPINLFTLAKVSDQMTSIHGDIRNSEYLTEIIQQYKPDILFHMAAQSLVRKSYEDPIDTFDVNVMGTVNVLNAIRKSDSVKVVINVTSDKCYENNEWPWGYREIDPFGGSDPYSASKGCAEIVANAFRRSFFKDNDIYLASVRAGNVIGGGDWAEDRLIPDIVRSCHLGKNPIIRNPNAIRPWQHVLEPLHGYMTLAKALWNTGETYAEGWNFGPDNENVLNVGEITQRFVNRWGNGLEWAYDRSIQPKEAQVLRLDCSKARTKLLWKPILTLDQTIEWTIDAYKHHYNGLQLKDIVMEQILAYDKLRSHEQ